MGCLYCGKEIGPFRLLRDSEFCTVRHREEYRERLGRVLVRMGAAEPAPAGIAGFRIEFPVQEGALGLVSVPMMAVAASWADQPDSPLLPTGPLPISVIDPGPAPTADQAAIPDYAAGMPLRSVEAAEPPALPSSWGMLRPARGINAPTLGYVRAPRTYIGVVDEAFSLDPPEPALVDVFPVMDSRPALRFDAPAHLRFALHAVDEPASCGRVTPEPELRPLRPASARPGADPVAAETMPSTPAFVPAALALPPAVRLPEFGSGPGIAAALRSVPLTAGAVAGPRPMAVESLPAFRQAVPVPVATRVPLRCPEVLHFQPAQEPSDALAAPAFAPGPAAVEALPTADAFSAVPLAPLAVMRRSLGTEALLKPAAGLTFAGFQELPAPPASPAQPGKIEPAPMPRVSAQPAGAQPERPQPQIPQPGFFPLEYHCHRSTAVPVACLAWIEAPVVVENPPFQLRAAFKRFAEYARPRHRLLPFEEILAGQRKDGEPVKIYFSAAAKIAATIMVGVALWTGSQMAQLSQHASAFRAQVATSERSVTAAAEVRRARTDKGPMVAFRQAVADRASTEVTDSFASGMEAWGASSKTWAPGWQRSPDGYVKTGEMALFQPSLRYTDYHMDFYGQIEEKSIGWVVRARDRQNYYAMKFAVIEPGLRPIIAMVHYQVTGGKRGHVVRTPLSVMVHNNEPYHVSVEVRGNHFAAAIEGELVDSWTEDTLARGGVGFFSEPGERARLYWMKVSRNQDWLGRFCAYLSGDDRGGPSRASGLQLPNVPQFWALSNVPAGPEYELYRRSEGWIF